MKSLLRTLAAVVAAPLLLLMTAGSSHAQLDDQAHDFAKVRLIAGAPALDGAGVLPLGLHFELADGWKVYWRNPGDAGYPPTVDWAGSKNLDKTDIRWPAPERFTVLGIEGLGYKDEVVLPLKATVQDLTAPLELKGTVDFLACSDICVPVRTEVSLNLPPSGDGTAHETLAQLINRYESRVPLPQADGGDAPGGLGITAAGLTGSALRVAIASAVPLAGPDLFVEGPDGAFFGAPRVAFTPDRQRAVLELAVDTQGLDIPLSGREVVLTLIDGQRAVERRVALDTLAPALPGPFAEGTTIADPAPQPGLVIILAFAVLGGLILNLMPCVLPVLSIKLLSVVSHGGGAAREVRVGFLASAAGIVTAFMILAGALIGLKLAGAAIGWGIQFQQPWFLVFMVLVVTLFAANLWGLFEVRLPSAVMNVGGDGAGHGLAGHFSMGMFATLLATPCSAPFLGTAVGFALSRGAGEIAAVFAALGVGLALPYLTVAAFPRLATRLPRPGPWMVTLRKVLGLALAATALWLVWVLAGVSGWTAAGAVGAAAGAVVALLALKHLAGLGTRTAAGGIALLAAAAFALPLALGTAPSSGDNLDDRIEWQAFDQRAIARHVAEGRVVFVDVTADWCLTCIANKTVVVGREPVVSRLGGKGVVAMKADWTRPDPIIAAYLQSFGRYGIPFNVVYGPDAPDGITLPEILTPGAVLAALDAAGPGTEAVGPVAGK